MITQSSTYIPSDVLFTIYLFLSDDFRSLVQNCSMVNSDWYEALMDTESGQVNHLWRIMSLSQWPFYSCKQLALSKNDWKHFFIHQHLLHMKWEGGRPNIDWRVRTIREHDSKVVMMEMAQSGSDIVLVSIDQGSHMKIWHKRSSDGLADMTACSASHTFESTPSKMSIVIIGNLCMVSVLCDSETLYLLSYHLHSAVQNALQTLTELTGVSHFKMVVLNKEVYWSSPNDDDDGEGITAVLFASRTNMRRVDVHQILVNNNDSNDTIIKALPCIIPTKTLEIKDIFAHVELAAHQRTHLNLAIGFPSGIEQWHATLESDQSDMQGNESEQSWWKHICSISTPNPDNNTVDRLLLCDFERGRYAYVSHRGQANTEQTIHVIRRAGEGSDSQPTSITIPDGNFTGTITHDEDTKNISAFKNSDKSVHLVDVVTGNTSWISAAQADSISCIATDPTKVIIGFENIQTIAVLDKRSGKQLYLLTAGSQMLARTRSRTGESTSVDNLCMSMSSVACSLGKVIRVWIFE